MNNLHPLLKPYPTLSFQFWLIVVPGTVIAGAILAAASFVVAPPSFGW